MKLAIRWMGHADEKMILLIYDHITDLRIQSAVKSINAFNNPQRASNGRQQTARKSRNAI